jgi:hypothetical protein
VEPGSADEFDGAGVGRRDGALHHVRWHRVVCDEAAFVKNLSTIRAQAVHRLRRSHCWLITGSPVQNNIKELQTLLTICNPSLPSAERHWRSLCRHVLLRRTMSSVVSSVRPQCIRMLARTAGPLALPCGATRLVRLVSSIILSRWGRARG